MKFCFLLFAFLFFTVDPLLTAQTHRTIQPPGVPLSNRFVNQKKTTLQNQAPPVFLDPKTVALQHKWDVSLTQFGIHHESEIPKTRMDSIKQEGRRIRQQSDSIFQAQGHYRYEDTKQVEGNRMTATPYVNNSFKGNKYDAWSPPDNNLAVSDNGHLVSVINNSILIMDVSGNIILEENFEDFFSTLDLNGGYFDPKVLYDPDEDKFIVVVLNGNTPATSTIVVAFSSTSDPNAGWWMYTFNGDPSGNNLWVDYPSIGISTDDLYISGNLYTEDRLFSQVMILQFGKGEGYLGQTLHGVHYFDIKDAYGISDFTVVPISYGFDGTIGPGIYLVSTDGAGGTEATLYYTDANAQNNPNIYAYSVPITNYYTPFDGLMLGTNDELETNDCRTLSGFYADGTVHFVFNTRGDDFHTKVYYCRLKIEDLSNASVRIGLQPFEYAYPSIAPFATTETDKSVLIGFLRTSGTIYPEFRMMAVDHDMNYEGSHLVKAGQSFANASQATSERWGDYSGISRRHNAERPEVWISGCYGEDHDNGGTNVLSTWIGQVTDEQADVPPNAVFTANQTEIMIGQSVQFTDHSTNLPTGWSWTFQGGTPSTSTQQHPMVTYNAEGIYDVTLQANNAFGNDVEVKTGYITVTGNAQLPIADFTSDITNVSAGGTVQFQDLSANNPTKWQWFFPGGSPSLSGEQNPVIVYTEPGCHNVTLNAQNAAGTDVISKTCYIDVLTAVVGSDTLFSKFLLFPNPVSSGKLNVEFEMAHATELDFLIIDDQGRVIKNLMHRIVKAGLNNLSFHTEPLSPGMYYLVILNKGQSLIKSEKFMVTR